jgi:hypothetical protein
MSVSRIISGVTKLSLVTLSLANVALADGVEDFSHQFNQQRFYNYPQSARTLGMGSSSAVTSAGAYSVLSNPAGMGFQKDADVTVGYAYDQLSGKDASNYSNIEQERDSGYALASLPIMPYTDAPPAWGNFGFGWSGYDGDVNDADDTTTDGYGLHFAYAKAVSDSLSLGYGISVLNDNVDSVVGKYENNDAIKHTVGAQYKMSDSTMLGLSTFYGTGEGEYDGAKTDLDSWGVEAGISEKMSDSLTLAFSTDYVSYEDDVINTNAWGFKVGAEQVLTDSLVGRLGYRYQSNVSGGFGDTDSDTAKFNAVSFGLGAELGLVNLDYGAEYRSIGQGDWSHLVSATVPFSLCQ